MTDIAWSKACERGGYWQPSDLDTNCTNFAWNLLWYCRHVRFSFFKEQLVQHWDVKLIRCYRGFNEGCGGTTEGCDQWSMGEHLEWVVGGGLHTAAGDRRLLRGCWQGEQTSRMRPSTSHMSRASDSDDVKTLALCTSNCVRQCYTHVMSNKVEAVHLVASSPNLRPFWPSCWAWIMVCSESEDEKWLRTGERP